MSIITAKKNPAPLRMRLATLATIVLLPMLGACGANPADAGKVSTGTTAQPSAVLRIGIDPSFAPYEFEDNGSYSGSEIDIARALGEQLNMRVEFSKIGFNSLIPALSASRVDVTMVGGWADSPERRSAMNLVDYFQAHTALLVKANDGSSRLKDLCGKSVAVLQASVYVSTLEKQKAACAADGQPPLDILQLSQDSAVLAVKSGQAQARIDEGGLVGFITKQNPDLKMNTLTDDPPFTAAIGVGKNNDELAKKVSRALEELRNSGKLAEIFAKWGIPADWLLPKITLNGE
ncbi:ABC transporter substrate-binding protein [Arthrobacter sp. 135MFCol5.1]|uniref:ABC transporter substrate-binding protein n=1 Tax=Arthrobacter sp. 135MFCol5.1 TaxID=1158050 RepID=UPI0003670AA0|nr:transporter substrate-binding domain-containing protein [Arthrobacter sp. 135MFCol5.1]